MAMTYECAYCTAELDFSSDDTLVVDLYRRIDSADVLEDAYGDAVHETFKFCSQQHLADYMREFPLPPPASERMSDEKTTLGEVVGCSVAIILFLALSAGAAYGFLTLVRDLL